MELALQEYDSLRTTNECLKAQARNVFDYEEMTIFSVNPNYVSFSTMQFAKTMSTKPGKTPVGLCPRNPELFGSSRPSIPFLACDQSAPIQLIWPSIVQPPNVIQTQKATNLVPEQPNLEIREGLHPRFYILPCPFFVPISTRLQLGPSVDTTNEQVVVPKDNRYATSSSTKMNGYGIVQDVRGAQSSSSKTAQFRFQVPEIVPSDKTFSSSICSFDPVVAEKLDSNAPTSKKQADALAAAEARKRRKMITKLKRLHYR